MNCSVFGGAYFDAREMTVDNCAFFQSSNVDAKLNVQNWLHAKLFGQGNVLYGPLEPGEIIISENTGSGELDYLP